MQQIETFLLWAVIELSKLDKSITRTERKKDTVLSLGRKSMVY